MVGHVSNRFGRRFIDLVHAIDLRPGCNANPAGPEEQLND
jgi:hypothetical protein